VLAAHAWDDLVGFSESDLVYAADNGTLEVRLIRFRRAFASILAVLAPMAGIDRDSVGWPDMGEDRAQDVQAVARRAGA